MAMPTAPAQPVPADPDATLGMCLLHADYHPMNGECWGAILDWMVSHDHIPEADRRAVYAADVERAMLDTLLPTLQSSSI